MQTRRWPANAFGVRFTDAIAGEGWVVDGSFSGRVFDLTLARADTHIGRIRPARLWRVLRARQCRAAEIDQNLCMALRESARAYWLTVVHAQP